MSSDQWDGFREELRQGEVSPHVLLSEHPIPSRPAVETLMLWLTGDYQQHRHHPLSLARRILITHNIEPHSPIDSMSDDQRLAISADLMHVRLHGSLAP